jgi:hypothetical protein
VHFCRKCGVPSGIGGERYFKRGKRLSISGNDVIARPPEIRSAVSDLVSDLRPQNLPLRVRLFDAIRANVGGTHMTLYGSRRFVIESRNR